MFVCVYKGYSKRVCISSSLSLIPKNLVVLFNVVTVGKLLNIPQLLDQCSISLKIAMHSILFICYKRAKLLLLLHNTNTVSYRIWPVLFFFFARVFHHPVWLFGDWRVCRCVYYIPAGRGGGPPSED